MWSTVFVVTNCFLVVLGVPLVTITAPSEQGGSSPTEGNQIFYMECSIQNFQTPGSPALFRSAWSKDGDIIIWNTVVKSTEYRLREIQKGTNLLQFVDFTQLTVRHSGLYKCFAAEGDQSSYTEVASDAIWISVLSSSGFYLPPPQWPECNPQNVAVLLYTELNISCATDPGNPEVSIAFDFQGQSLTDSSTISNSSSEMTLMHTATILPEYNGKSFTCSITSPDEPFRNRTRECSTGIVKVELAEVKTLTLSDGSADSVLKCRVPTGDTLRWVADTESQSQRLTTASNVKELAMLKNIEISDNDTTISCTAVRSNITDYIHIIVIPKDQSSTKSPTDLSTFPVSQTATLPFVSNTTEPAIFFTSTIIGIIAGGGVFLLLLVISCIIVCVCHCKKDEIDDEKESDEDVGDPTRISTGYVWDRELSSMLKDSPAASPKLTEKRYHHTPATQPLQQDPQEARSDSMSPSLMFAMTHLSADDTLRKPNNPDASYESVKESDFQNVNRLSSIHPDFHASTSGPAPSGPAPPPPSQESPTKGNTYDDVKIDSVTKGPTYAVPDKILNHTGQAYDVPEKIQKSDTIPAYAYASSDTSKQLTQESEEQGESAYALVHPDPENPIVRALSEKQDKWIANGGHKPEEPEDDEEGFVENKIYEPAGPNP
ncbi:uncharacterized protein [Amphiura filiformis]|uniref:uncharacterized protein n=1 Tax=Amphiura filiformis TaxID=82378 RepID=UPI003B21450D